MLESYLPGSGSRRSPEARPSPLPVEALLLAGRLELQVGASDWDYIANACGARLALCRACKPRSGGGAFKSGITLRPSWLWEERKPGLRAESSWLLKRSWSRECKALIWKNRGAISGLQGWSKEPWRIIEISSSKTHPRASNPGCRFLAAAPNTRSARIQGTGSRRRRPRQAQCARAGGWAARSAGAVTSPEAPARAPRCLN